MSAKKPKISVIMPFFNGDPQFLKEAVGSVLCQTFEDFELILVNDGSDASYDTLIKEIKKKDDRIRVIEQSNQGVSSARNHGVREARGEYVTFVDADDLVMPKFLEAAVRATRETGAEFVVGGASYQNSRIDMPQINEYKIRQISYEQISSFKPHLVSDPVKIDGGGHIPRGSVARLVKTEMVRKVPFHEDISIGEDIIWNLELVKLYRNACLVDQIWYIYYENASSATHRYDPKMFDKCDSELKTVAGLVDLTRDDEYRSFVNYIYEELQRVISCSFRWKQWQKETAEPQKVLDKVYHEAPWKEMTCERYGKLVKGKRKIRYYLQKSKLFIKLYSILGK
ncbi:MAG: glycosyltransferase [Lachnospiraceae bacterium]|nr:glycosyltransferase [Lachnospiraceae bacterium]